MLNPCPAVRVVSGFFSGRVRRNYHCDSRLPLYLPSSNSLCFFISRVRSDWRHFIFLALSFHNPIFSMGVVSALCISLYAALQFRRIYGESHCDASIYGKPEVNHCFDLYNQLPGETLSPDINPDAPRSFVEPKFLEPPFTPVPNPYMSQMVQLPKIWRAGLLQWSLAFRSAQMTQIHRNMPLCANEHCRCTRNCPRTNEY